MRIRGFAVPPTRDYAHKTYEDFLKTQNHSLRILRID